ncbi:MAG: bifunctional phosphoribosylaminoimidazolecarboxamide formyltransferase/IMP cyclohydrolase, partial [Dermabacter sp.]|nr:bifunctional phosphoribosylaminoimidazolecarboxamide formyltransferase/IMP cyclohydrolase [Dermabacter sp.]
MSKRAVTRALVSVYDKTGLIELATGLHANGVEIVSTGSTAKAIAEAGIPVTAVENVTGFPEILDGRVKTLHPKIHGGLLADRNKPSHVAALEEHAIAPIDLLVCNLYPFEDTVASGASFDDIVEKIDIGGPAMVRSAAKNFSTCAVVTSIEQYDLVEGAVADGGFTREERLVLAADAFSRIAEYDAAIE